jgi:hypothetical protein
MATSLYLLKVEHKIFLASVNSDVATLGSLSLFLAGNNCPSFHHQLLCTEDKHPLQFDNAPNVLYRHSHAVPSVLM